MEPWEDVMDATAEKIGCPSVVSMESLKKLDDVLDIEDCLTMTITTPNTTGRYPVLVYVHGEYLYEGSNSEAPPDYLLEKDIVLVTPQYRLGPFGFLSTKTDEIPGNAGVLDIYLALQFVKHFIKYFGGDENRVTLAGQVGGAAITHLLAISPMVRENNKFAKDEIRVLKTITGTKRTFPSGDLSLRLSSDAHFSGGESTTAGTRGRPEGRMQNENSA